MTTSPQIQNYNKLFLDCTTRMEGTDEAELLRVFTAVADQNLMDEFEAGLDEYFANYKSEALELLEYKRDTSYAWTEAVLLSELSFAELADAQDRLYQRDESSATFLDEVMTGALENFDFSDPDKQKLGIMFVAAIGIFSIFKLELTPRLLAVLNKTAIMTGASILVLNTAQLVIDPSDHENQRDLGYGLGMLCTILPILPFAPRSAGLGGVVDDVATVGLKLEGYMRRMGVLNDWVDFWTGIPSTFKTSLQNTYAERLAFAKTLFDRGYTFIRLSVIPDAEKLAAQIALTPPQEPISLMQYLTLDNKVFNLQDLIGKHAVFLVKTLVQENSTVHKFVYGTVLKVEALSETGSAIRIVLQCDNGAEISFIIDLLNPENPAVTPILSFWYKP